MTVAFNITEILCGRGYSLIRGMDRGGFSSIFLVQSHKYNKKFVLKCSKVKDTTEDLREVEVMTHLLHQNILRCYDYWIEDNILYEIIDYCPKGNLYDYLQRVEINPADIKALILQICYAIEYMHEQGYAHNDIKANNILIDDHSRPLIADFGLSTLVNGLSHDFVGTPQYMAPEILRHEMYDPFLADIWSLGITIYVILNRHFPYIGRSPEAILTSIEQDTLVFPDTMPDEYLVPLESLLQIDPKKRISISECICLFGTVTPTKLSSRRITSYSSCDFVQEKQTHQQIHAKPTPSLNNLHTLSVFKSRPSGSIMKPKVKFLPHIGRVRHPAFSAK